MGNKFNKGEWAELFVFLKTLSEGKIYAADENLNKIENLFYTVLSVLQIDDNNRKEYLRNDANKHITLNLNDNEEITLPIHDFEYFADVVLKKIKTERGTFEINEVESFLANIQLDKIKSGSNQKKDIIFKIHDDFTGTEPEIGFSIKSYIGNKPTLLNASGATRIQYHFSKVIEEEDARYVNSIDTRTKIKDRLQYLQTKNIALVFYDLLNGIFKRNLQMIDYRMPEILGNLFLLSYFVDGKAVSEVVELYCQEYNEDLELIEYKIKDLLVAVALGMEPNTRWSGVEDANGGYLVVKDSGEVLCYHIYDRNKLREYLYRNTRFDSPSSKRTGAGVIFSEYDIQKFILTVQIRFQ